MIDRDERIRFVGRRGGSGKLRRFVRRDPATGDILIGAQHENHNHKPGSLYDGGGYSLTSRAIHAGEEKVRQPLSDYPQLVEDVSIRGARPLHVCVMSPAGQRCTQIFIDAGTVFCALDTYGYNTLYRMVSNDLDIGAEALVRAGVEKTVVSWIAAAKDG